MVLASYQNINCTQRVYMYVFSPHNKITTLNVYILLLSPLNNNLDF
jgi:hypothetical protein